MASPDSNSSSSLTALEINTVPVAGFENQPKSQMASFSALRKEHTSSVSSGDTETSHFRSLASPFSHQMDTTTPSPPNVNFDIPQWKKDLIQRRKTNIAKTIAAATGNSAKEDTIANVNSTDALGSVSPNCDSKNGIVFTNNNNSSDKLPCSSSINTNDTNKSNTSQNSITNNSKTIINNVVKTPVTTQTQTQLQQQKVKIEFLYGGHYTQVNNKPSASDDSIHHYTEKLQTRSASVLQSQSQSQQLPSSVLVSRSVVVGSIEKNIYDGNGSSSTTLPQPQENVRFRKKFTDQRGTINSNNSNTSTTSTSTTTTTTTSSDSAVSDSLLTSKSRLSSGLKVAAEAEVEFSKKNNNDNNSSGLCVSDEQQKHNLHIFQQKPDLATNMSKDNNNDNGGGDGEQGEDDEYHQNQLICRRESDSSSSACVVSLNDFDSKDTDSKLFSTTEHKYKTTNVSCLTPSSSAPLKTVPGAGIGIIKKPCGIESDSVRSSSGSLPFIKNQNIGNVNTIGSTHHNYKINTKVRCSNQNQNTSLAPSVLKTTAASNESSSKSVTNNTKKMVAVRDMNEITKNELDFDPSEELQYGPGIVSKLRCRYLSLALRQSMDKQRLSIDSLRRATSLNNLLDEKCVHEEDDDEYDTSDTINKETTSPSVAVSQVGSKGTTSSETVIGYGYKRNSKDTPENITCPTGLSYNNQHRSRHIKRGNDSLKRARSVEALLCEKSPWNFSNSQLSNETNAAASDVVTIDDKINNARERLLSGTDNNPPKRLASIIDDTERPPPDLVKQTLKIFEASTNRRSRTTNRNSGEVATKVANYKFIITQNKPAITFPKPPVSPKKPNQKSKPITSEAVNNIISTPSPIIVSPIQQADKIVSPLSSTPTPKSRSINKKTAKSKKESTPIRNVGTASSVLESLSDNSPDIIPRHKFFEKTATPLDSPVTEITKSIEKLRIESPTTPTQPTLPLQTPSFKDRHSKFSSESSERESEDDDDDDESLDGEYVVNVEEKHISKSALENISKAGSSQQFLFADNHASSNLNGDSPAPTYLHDIPTVSTSSSSTNTVKQIGIIRPLLAEPRHSKIKNNSTEEISFNQVQPALTSREIEKNKINNEKKVEISGGENISMAKITGSIVTSNLNKIDVARNEDDNNSQALGWSSAIIPRKKRTAAGSLPENNTMIFNFKDRKEVPDYIENDGLIFKHKRELPKPNESGFVLLDDLSLETSTDPDDEWSMCLPSPCDVEFENANIIIDGKSNIKIGPKESNFHVQFNDTLTSTFEYPSESSMIADSDSVYADLSSFDASRSPSGTTTDGLSEEIESPVVHHHVKSEEIIQLPHNNKVLGNLSLGSAPLGSYTPITAKTENMFQLGVTREPSSQLVKTDDANSNENLPADFYGESSLEYLKPASDDLTIAYSEGSLKTDLLY